MSRTTRRFTLSQHSLSLPLLLVTAGIFSLSLLAYLRTHDVLNHNSDLLYIPTLFRDINEWGGRFSEWRLTPAPYFFPDMSIYFLVARLAQDWQLAVTISAIIQLLLFSLGWCALGWAFFEEQSNRHFYAAFVLLILALLLGTPRISVLFEAQFWISIHFGIMLVLPYTLFGVLRLLQGRNPLIYTAVLALGFALIFSSDGLSLVQLVLPLLAAVLFLKILDRTGWYATFCLLGATAFGWLVAELARRIIDYPPFPSHLFFDLPGRIGNSLSQLISSAKLLWSAEPAIPTALVAALVIHLAYSLLGVYRVARQRQVNDQLLLISVFSLTAFAMTVAAVIAAGLYADWSSRRYLYPVTVLPIYSLLPIAFHWIKGRRLSRPMLGAAALFVLASLWPALRPGGTLGRHVNVYPELVACIDAAAAERDVEAGVATYWDAKYVSMFSRKGVKLFQIHEDFTTYVWISNPRWYERFRPAFIVHDPDEEDALRLDLIINRYGYPQEIVDCQTRELWFYNRPEDSWFQSSFGYDPALAKWWQPTASADIPAYVWRGDVGASDGSSVVASDEIGEIARGWLYFHPAGVYQLDVSYEYSGDSEDPKVAVLAVGLINVESGAIKWIRQPLMATDRSNSLQFELDEMRTVIVELRFKGRGIFTVHGFHMRKLAQR